MPQLGVTMPGLGTPIEKFSEWARLAEDAGFDCVWDYEIWRNPFTIHMTCAASTQSIALGTGIATAFTRSPYELANAAADVDEYSGGRLVLGLGPGAAEFLTWFHNSHGRHQASRLSEYVDVVRMSWDQLATQDPSLSYEGEHYRFESSPMNPWGGRELVRTRIPIYLAGLRPRMLEVAGEKGDGWIGYMTTPGFLAEVVRPSLEAGAARSGRSLEDFTMASETICCVHDDPKVALQRGRQHVGLYVCNPASDAVVAHHGLDQDRDAVRQAVMAGGLAAARDATSDALVHTMSLTGTPDEVRDAIGAYDGALDHVILHPPYMPPFTPAETEDAYRRIVSAFAR